MALREILYKWRAYLYDLYLFMGNQISMGKWGCFSIAIFDRTHSAGSSTGATALPPWAFFGSCDSQKKMPVRPRRNPDVWMFLGIHGLSILGGSCKISSKTSTKSWNKVGSLWNSHWMNWTLTLTTILRNTCRWSEASGKSGFQSPLRFSVTKSGMIPQFNLCFYYHWINRSKSMCECKWLLIDDSPIKNAYFP